MHWLLQKPLQRWQEGASTHFHFRAVPYSVSSVEETGHEVCYETARHYSLWVRLKNTKTSMEGKTRPFLQDQLSESISNCSFGKGSCMNSFLQYTTENQRNHTIQSTDLFWGSLRGQNIFRKPMYPWATSEAFVSYWPPHQSWTRLQQISGLNYLHGIYWWIPLKGNWR